MSEEEDIIIQKRFVEPPPFGRFLSYGLKGKDVKYVQKILKDEGCFKGVPRGNFLELTKDAVQYFQNTHLGEDGEFLEPDGIVGPKTWWALHNAHGEAQRSFVPVEEIKADDRESEPRQEVLKFLFDLYEKGVREIPNGSNYGDGLTPIINACGFKFGIPWCMAIQSYAEFMTFDEAPLGAMHVSCSKFWNEAVRWGRAFPKGTGYTPVPGDIGIYNYNGGLRKGRLSGSGHAVRVVRVSEDAKSFNALEGNAGNRFKHSIRREAENTFVGYVNLFQDEKDPPEFARGLSKAPVVVLTLADSR